MRPDDGGFCQCPFLACFHFKISELVPAGAKIPSYENTTRKEENGQCVSALNVYSACFSEMCEQLHSTSLLEEEKLLAQIKEQNTGLLVDRKSVV